MDVQSILEKILSDARQAASDTLEQARQRAMSQADAAKAQLDAQRKAMEERVRADSAEMESRLTRMAELEEKKALLAVKRQVMDEAFSQAVDALRRLPNEKKRAFFLAELTGAAQGGESVCVGEVENGWFDDRFLAEANAALAKKGVNQPLAKGESVPGCGFEMRLGGAALNCTFESLVEGQRMALEGEVSRALFENR